MLYINKITSSSIIDYAAEELKKYLRMMMPEGGDVKIAYAPESKCGFRLGVMADLGISLSKGEDAKFDDVIFIDTDETGGIIAGANPRAVLLAVYEYLRQNGCRWLFPGIDGEYIPMQDIVPVKYRHTPTSRVRGDCIEGTPTQKILLDFIDFLPKVGMNTYMIQFRVPAHFYRRRYNRESNQSNFSPETLSDEQITKWTVETECEVAKRGLILHSYGHGFTTDPFGIDSAIGWREVESSDYPKEVFENYALLDGKRDFFRKKPLNTQICMSNPAIRRKVAKYAADYALRHSNIDYLHIWLADGCNNHCECEECKKMRPSDYYVMMLNEMDEELTKVGSDMHLVIIVYVDTFWAPITEKIKNPERFSIMLAPITRDYSMGYGESPDVKGIVEYERNKLTFPATFEESIAYYNEWARAFRGQSFVYEYHFWVPQHFDLSGQEIAARIHDDIVAYRKLGFDGIVACGSQRSFFPNGLAFYTMARTLYDSNLTTDEIKDDYYTHAYGDAAKEFDEALGALNKALSFEYISTPAATARPEKYATKDAAENIAKARAARANLAKLVEKYYNSDYRIQTVSVRILEAHDVYLRYVIDILEKKSQNDDEDAKLLVEECLVEMGKLEPCIEAYFDQAQAANALRYRILTT